MEIFVLSKPLFDKLMETKGIDESNIESKDVFFISINNTLSFPELLQGDSPYFKNDKSNLKVMYFDDVSEDVYLDGKLQSKAFTEDQGKGLLEFIEKNKDKKSCVVHCTAGISRSGAVGLFINDYFKGDYFEFMKVNQYVKPNPHISRVLNNLSRSSHNTNS